MPDDAGVPPPVPIDTEERCRTAATRLPRPGAATRAFGRWFDRTRRGLIVGVLLTPALLLLGLPMPALLGLLAGLLVVVVAARLALGPVIAACRRADGLYVAGRVDDAATVYHEALHRPLVLPAARAVAAVGLARCAVVAGHADRAVVLLRAIEASESLPRAHDDALRASTALALLALGRPGEAREVTRSLATPLPGLVLLIEALAGPIEDALRAADAPPPDPAPGEDPVHHALRVRLGWLLRAYVAERVARAAPTDAVRASAETRRDAARLTAGDVPPWMHRYLHAAWPDFGAFAGDVTERTAAPVASAP